MSTNSREEFENIFSLPPYEFDLDIQGKGALWEGQYSSYPAQCAYEAWERCDLLRKKEIAELKATSAEPVIHAERLVIQDPIGMAERMPQLEQDSKRYRWLRDNGGASGKQTSRAVIGTPLKAKLSFTYWCSVQELDSLIDGAITQQTDTK